MRLIDADALLAQLENLLKTSEDDAKYSGRREASVTWDDAIYAIKIAPTIELELICCKDCRYWQERGLCQIEKGKGEADG